MASSGNTHNPGIEFSLGTTTVTYSATDGVGNIGTCSFTVTVVDATAPVFTGCPSNISVSAGVNCKAVATWTAPVATDNCSVASRGNTHNPGSEFSLGTTTVTYSATDGAGNIGTCSFTVTVVDTTAPVFTGCPSNITVAATTNCKAIATWTAPVATDNCGVANSSTTHNSGSEFSLGITTVTYSATDVSGNTTTCAFIVTVTDTTPPSFTSFPAPPTASAGTNCKAVVSWVSPVATDCSNVTITSSHSSGSEFIIGSTSVTYTATDAFNNITTRSFTVIVVDTILPVIMGCPVNISITAGANCKANATWIAPLATDNCTVASITSSHSPGSEFNIGTTRVIYSATDGSGNLTTCQFNVTVISDLPQVSDCPANIQVITDETDQALVTWKEPTFTSKCGTITVQKSHSPSSRFPIGTTQVVYDATDGLGNSVRCTFSLEVTIPVLELQISKLITPDGDGFNDFWQIENAEKYPNNSVTVFDRWGSIIYSDTGYDNQKIVWRGLNKSNALVPTGTYFYLVEATYGNQKLRREGFIELAQ